MDLVDCAIILAIPVTGMVLGRFAWALFCARTRRAACQVFQFRLRDLMILSLVACLVGGIISVLRDNSGPYPSIVIWTLFQGPSRGYSCWEEFWGWSHWYSWSTGLPSIFFIAAGMPLVLLLWQSAGEWLSDRWRKVPPPKLVDLTWLKSVKTPQCDLVCESRVDGAICSPHLHRDFACVWPEFSDISCQMVFTYEAVPACWPNAANYVSSPGLVTAASILVAIPASAGDSLSQKEWIDYGNEF